MIFPTIAIEMLQERVFFAAYSINPSVFHCIYYYMYYICILLLAKLLGCSAVRFLLRTNITYQLPDCFLKNRYQFTPLNYYTCLNFGHSIRAAS